MEAQFAKAARVFKDVSKSLKEQAQEFMSNDTPLEKQLKEATANTNWGCANSILGEIARAANDYHDYNIIMRHVWEALAAKPKYWRRVFKALTLLEYLIRHGPERVVDEVRDCLYRLRSLSGFHYTDEGKDRGGGVREKAKQIIDLVSDTELLRAEREKARQNRDRYVGIGAHGEMTGHIGGDFSGGGFGNSDYYSSSSGGKYPEYPGVRGTGRSMDQGRGDQDAEKEQKRVAAEREKARLQREKQKEKSLRKQSSLEEQHKPSRRGSKKSESYSSSESSSSESSSDDSAPRKTRKKLPEKKSSKGAATDFFNTDVGWGAAPSTTSTPGQTFASGFDNFPAFTAPPQHQSIHRPPFPTSTSVSMSFPPPPQSSSPMSQMSAPTVSTSAQVNQPIPDFFTTPAASASHSMPTMIQQPQQSQFTHPSTFGMTPQQQQAPSVQSLMAQNLAHFSALGPPATSQQGSRNPFGMM